jgi:pimeloyl-ACP methyl ester carboxylesterase
MVAILKICKLQSLEILMRRFGAAISRKFLGGRFAKPDPAKPLGVDWYRAKPGEQGRRLFVFLPGRRDRGADFIRRGFVAMAQGRIPGLDCVAVDATIGYYLDGSIADRLQREIVGPARTVGYREIWLIGVSMGGLGALFRERQYPGGVNGLILLAPFVGDDLELFKEMDAAGGAVSWACSQPAVSAGRNKAEFQRDLWRFLGELKFDRGVPLKIWLAYGEADRLLPGIERFSRLLPSERVLPLPGGHTWQVWTRGFTEILAKIDWDRS